MTLDLPDLKKLVDKKYKLTSILYKATGNRYSIGIPCFCPFHDNTNTPAAAIYEDDGEQSLYCFAEQKLYKSSDALEKLLNQNIYKLGESIWLSMSPEEQIVWRDENTSYASSFDIETTNTPTDTFSKGLNSFKYNKITFKELKKYLELKILEKVDSNST